AEAAAFGIDEPVEATVEVDELPFTAKSLQEQEEPRVEIRYDAPHARTSHRPHARFAAPRPESKSADQALESAPAKPPQVAAASLTHEELELLLEADAANYLPSSSDELAFAEVVEEPLASDLIPVEPTAENATQPEASPASSDKKLAALWEVDRFHW